MLSALVEEVSDTGGTHTDEHLDEVRTAGVEERDSGLASNGLGNEGLTCSRRSYEQDSLGNLGSDFGVFLRILEELDHFLELVLGLFLACDVLECDLDFLVGVLLCVALSELHHLSAACCLAQKHDGESDEDEPGKELEHERQDGDIRIRAFDHYIVGLEQFKQIAVAVRDACFVFGAVLQGEDDVRAVLDVRGCDIAGDHGLLECRVRNGIGIVVA